MASGGRNWDSDQRNYQSSHNSPSRHARQMATLECHRQPMPALKNPRHERFAQLIFEGITNGEAKPYYQQRAYLAVGYTPKDVGKRNGSAQAASSRLLSRVMQRVREFQAQAAKHTHESADKIVRELNEVLSSLMMFQFSRQLRSTTGL